MSEFRRVTSGLQTEMRDAISEFEREVTVDDSPPAYSPPTPAETPAAPPVEIPAAAPTPAPTPGAPPPPAESTWVFPDLSPEPPESSEGEPSPEAARPESES